MKRYKLPWYICLTYCFLGISLPFLVSLFAVRNRLDIGQPVQDYYLNLAEKDFVSQVFTANHDYLNIVILNLKNPALASKGDYLFLLETQDGKTLVERIFSGYNVGDPSSIRFQFDPIPASKNKKFRIFIKRLTEAEPSLRVAASGKEGLNFFVYYRSLGKKSAAVDFWRNLGRIFQSDWRFFGFWFIFLLTIARIGIITAGQRNERN